MKYFHQNKQKKHPHCHEYRYKEDALQNYSLILQ